MADEEFKKKVLEMYDDYYTSFEISKRLQVSRATVLGIINNSFKEMLRMMSFAC